MSPSTWHPHSREPMRRLVRRLSARLRRCAGCGLEDVLGSPRGRLRTPGAACVFDHSLIPLATRPRPEPVVKGDGLAGADQFDQLAVELCPDLRLARRILVLWVLDALLAVALKDGFVDRQPDRAASLERAAVGGLARRDKAAQHRVRRLRPHACVWSWLSVSQSLRKRSETAAAVSSTLPPASIA